MRCIINWCCKTPQMNKKKVTLYRFPTDPVLLQVWINAIGDKMSGELNRNSAVCGSHFDRNDKKKAGTKFVLKKGAVPQFLEKGETRNVKNVSPLGNLADEESSAITDFVCVNDPTEGTDIRMVVDVPVCQPSVSSDQDFNNLHNFGIVDKPSTSSNQNFHKLGNTEVGIMAKSCCIQGCTSGKTSTLFSFPTHNKSLSKKWIQQITGHTKKNPSSSLIVICSKHFSDVDFYLDSTNGTTVLQPNAVPNIFANEIKTPFEKLIQLFASALQGFPELWKDWTPETNLLNDEYNESIVKLAAMVSTTPERAKQQLKWCLTKFIKYRLSYGVPWKYNQNLHFLSEMTMLKSIPNPTVELQSVSDSIATYQSQPLPKYNPSEKVDSNYNNRVTPRFRSLAAMIERDLNKLDGKRATELTMLLLDVVKRKTTKRTISARSQNI